MLDHAWQAIDQDGRPNCALASESTPSLGFYGVVIALAFLAPKVAAFGYLAVSIIAVLPRPTRFAPHRGSG